MPFVAQLVERPSAGRSLVQLQSAAPFFLKTTFVAYLNMKTILVQEMKYAQVNTEDLFPGCTWDGHSNHMPTPFTEITENEYWHRTSGITGMRTWRQQITDFPNSKMMRTLVFTQYGDDVYAISLPNNWRCASKEEMMSGEYSIIYQERPRYFKLGCYHKFNQSKNLGKCLTEYTCTECGCKRVVDSSD
jgi:hypothetical protein